MKKLVALLLVLTMAVSLAAFAETTDAQAQDTMLVYATSTFGQKFSPFFSITTFDREVVDLTSALLLASDRGGNIVRNGIEGETIPYNGTDYTYYGIGDVEVVMNEDGTVDYNLTMRDDIVFSDGHPADIDDVIFGIYVMCDPTYDGASTVYAQPIEGMDEYYNAMAVLSSLLIKAGRDNADFSKWDEATQTAFWADVDQAGASLAQEIVDYCLANYVDDYASEIGKTADEIKADPELQMQFGMSMWGYADAYFAGATAADYWKAIEAAYEGDIVTAAETESAGTALFDFIEGYTQKYGYGVAAGDAVPNIVGIRRTGDYSMTIHMTEYDATSIYEMAFYVAPLHYYGDESLYDYENNSFGFVKGDLSSVRAKTTEPFGCGPYI